MFDKLDDNTINNIIKIINKEDLNNLYLTSHNFNIKKYYLINKYLYYFNNNYKLSLIINNISDKFVYLFGIENLKKCKLLEWKDTYRNKNLLTNYINNIPISVFYNNRVCLGVDNHKNIFISFNISEYVYTISCIQKHHEKNSRLCVNNLDAYYQIDPIDKDLESHVKYCGCHNIFTCNYKNTKKKLKKILLEQIYF